jgi:hypothetical protein
MGKIKLNKEVKEKVIEFKFRLINGNSETTDIIGVEANDEAAGMDLAINVAKEKYPNAEQIIYTGFHKITFKE